MKITALYNLPLLSNMSKNIQKKSIRIINKNMIDQTQLSLIHLSNTNNMFKYNSILKL